MLQVATYLMCGWILTITLLRSVIKFFLNIGKDMDECIVLVFFQLASIITAS